MGKFQITVARVNEGEHQESEFTADAVSVSLNLDGSLTINEGDGRSRTLSATGWGALKVVRVPSSGERV